MFSFLSLLNDYVTTGLILLSKSAIILLQVIIILRFLFGLYSSIFVFSHLLVKN